MVRRMPRCLAQNRAWRDQPSTRRRGGYEVIHGTRRWRVTPADMEKQRLAFRDLLNRTRVAEEDQWEDIDQGSNTAPHDGTYEHTTYGEVTEDVGEWSNLAAFDSLSPFQEMWKQIETLQTEQPREGKGSKTNQQNRKQFAHNWQKLFPALVATYMTGKAQCDSKRCDRCTRRGVKEWPVWYVGFNSIEKKLFTTCRCHKSPAALLLEGYFPSSPVKPKFAFSLQMLDIFDRILGRGPISKQAFIWGLTSY
jgi:hypothetical protein